MSTNNPYIPNCTLEQEKMLKVVGLNSMDELFNDVPENLKLKNGLNMPNGMGEFDVMNDVKSLAAKNTATDQLTCFLGAGAYDGFIPSAINHLRSRSEFYTAYTPYQPEISQGTLRAIFEFQTSICELTGMDAANASMYDGATAVAEAAFMAHGINKKNKIVVSAGVHPNTRAVLDAYAKYRGMTVVVAPLKDGVTDVEAAKGLVDADATAFIVQNPNFLGQIEPAEELASVKAGTKALYVVAIADAQALAIVKTPAEVGADVAVGESQALGCPLNFGGPYVGFMATTSKHVRKLPGRIVGQSKDVDGNRAFVLTLQAREQHIRREKATSNICSNQALMALTNTMYLALLGKEGIKEAALQSASKARYLKDKLAEAGIKTVFNGPFFREFAVELPASVDEVNAKLAANGFLGGYNLEKDYAELKNTMLLCATEKRSKEEIDSFVSTLQAIKEGRI